MNLLCIDTTGRSLVLALVQPGRPLLGHVVDTAGKHAEVLLPEIGSLLREGELDVAALEAVAVTLGPGGFTSVRVGLATAKGLCVARARPLYAASSLRALAYGPLVDSATRVPVGGQPMSIAVVTQAYRGEVYAALYVAHGGELTEHLPPFHASPADALAALSAAAGQEPLGARYMVGDALEAMRAVDAISSWTVTGGASLTPTALAAAMQHEVNAERTRDVGALGPEYLRPPDAALPRAR